MSPIHAVGLHRYSCSACPMAGLRRSLNAIWTMREQSQQQHLTLDDLFHRACVVPVCERGAIFTSLSIRGRLGKCAVLYSYITGDVGRSCPPTVITSPPSRAARSSCVIHNSSILYHSRIGTYIIPSLTLPAIAAFWVQLIRQSAPISTEPKYPTSTHRSIQCTGIHKDD